MILNDNNYNNEFLPKIIAEEDVLPSTIGFESASSTINEDTMFAMVCVRVSIRSLLDRGEVQITSSDGTATSVRGKFLDIQVRAIFITLILSILLFFNQVL